MSPLLPGVPGQVDQLVPTIKVVTVPVLKLLSIDPAPSVIDDGIEPSASPVTSVFSRYLTAVSQADSKPYIVTPANAGAAMTVARATPARVLITKDFID